MTVKSFSGAPFGFQSHRFDLSGVHPKRKIPGTFIGLQTNINNNLGPGYYLSDDKNSSFNQTKLEIEARKPGWKRSYDLEQFSSMPYILNKEHYLLKQEQKRKLGPGYYTIDYSQFNSVKNVKGIMSAKEPRFVENTKEVSPGPGIYGEKGIPYTSKEHGDYLRKSASNIGYLQSGGTKERSIIINNDSLPPNTYNIISFTDELVNRQVSKRGPYDIFSLNRSKPIKTGHWAINPAHDLAPSHYNIKSSIEKLSNNEYSNHGKFLKMDQYPSKPHDRAYWNNPSRMPPDPNNQLAPCTYDSTIPTKRIHQVSAPAFNSSSKRNDKLSNTFFTQNFNQVGPGRYDLQRLLDCKYVNSHENVFLSKDDNQLSREKTQILEERLKAKNIPPHKKVLVDHIPTELSPCINTNLLLNQRQVSLKIN